MPTLIRRRARAGRRSDQRGAGTATGALPTLNFLTGLKANTTAFGQPLSVNATNYFRERQIEFGLRMKF